MKLLDKNLSSKLSEIVSEVVSRLNKMLETNNASVEKATFNSKEDACSRLKLVLMHDRSKLSPGALEKMKDELIDVISRYVEIDREALDLNLESESNSIALIASIPILRGK